MNRTSPLAKLIEWGKGYVTVGQMFNYHKTLPPHWPHACKHMQLKLSQLLPWAEVGGGLFLWLCQDGLGEGQ